MLTTRKIEATPMRLLALSLVFIPLLAGCVPMPPMSTDYGDGYAPCVPRAVDAGMCPREGWKRPRPVT